jgi:hypothetical protein
VLFRRTTITGANNTSIPEHTAISSPPARYTIPSDTGLQTLTRSSTLSRTYAAPYFPPLFKHASATITFAKVHAKCHFCLSFDCCQHARHICRNIHENAEASASVSFIGRAGHSGYGDAIVIGFYGVKGIFGYICGSPLFRYRDEEYSRCIGRGGFFMFALIHILTGRFVAESAHEAAETRILVPKC